MCLFIFLNTKTQFLTHFHLNSSHIQKWRLKVFYACLIFFFVVPGRLKPIPRMEYNYIMCSPADITDRRTGVFFQWLTKLLWRSSSLMTWKTLVINVYICIHFCVWVRSLSGFTTTFTILILDVFGQEKKTKTNKNVRYLYGSMFLWNLGSLEIFFKRKVKMCLDVSTKLEM